MLQQSPYKLFDLVAVPLYPGADHRKIRSTTSISLHLQPLLNPHLTSPLPPPARSLRHVMRDLGAEPVDKAHLIKRLTRASTSLGSSSGGGSVLSLGEWLRKARGRLALWWGEGRGASHTSSGGDVAGNSL